MKRTLLVIFSSLLCLVIFSCIRSQLTTSSVKSADYWKNQAINQIIPYWTNNAYDSVYGGFFTNLETDWKQGSDIRKYPSMIGRQVFSYSVAFLLTGDEKYLTMADKTKDFLLKNGWDAKYGGWYNSLNRDGSPADTSKNMFIQTYALTGLSMYYFVTHDRNVLSYIEKSNDLIESKMWDKENGGYFNCAERDWSLKDDRKSFAGEVAPVSGYLIYLYLATGDRKYYIQSEKIMDVVLARMKDEKTGWILETFDKSWNYLSQAKDIINEDKKIEDIVNVGHNLEVAWMLYRLYLINNNEQYFTEAGNLEKKIFKYGFSPATGLWHSSLEKNSSASSDPYTYWWIQAYGNMFSLNSFRLTNNKENIGRFEKGARAWDSYFLDKKYGDVFQSVDTSGKVTEPVKGNAYKAAYHNMEHCLLNYLYLSFWVNRQPANLYFMIKSPSDGEILYPSPLEDRMISIKKISSETGEKPEISSDKKSIILSGSGKTKIIVTLESDKQQK